MICIAGIKLASGLVTQIDPARSGRPTGHFENAAVLELLRELAIANGRRERLSATGTTATANAVAISQEQERGVKHQAATGGQQDSSGLEVLRSSGRTVCEAHYPVVGRERTTPNNPRKSDDTMRAVVVARVFAPFRGETSNLSSIRNQEKEASNGIKQRSPIAAATRLRVVYETGQIATVDIDWVRGNRWENDPLLEQAETGGGHGHGVFGASHEVTLRFLQLLTVPTQRQSADSTALGATPMAVEDKTRLMRNVVSAWLHGYPEHALTLGSLGRLASVLAGQAGAGASDDGRGRVVSQDLTQLQAEAEAILEAALPTMKAQLGPSHQVTIGAMGDYGAVLVQTLDFTELLNELQAFDDAQCRQTKYRMDEAQKRLWLEKQTSHTRPVLQIHSETVHRCTELYGPQHLLTLRAIYQLARVCLKFLLEKTARKMLERALKTATSVLGEQHPLTADIRTALARCDVLRLFNEIDADGSGELGVEEVRALGRWRWPGAPELTEQELAEAMAEMDPSGDHLVDAVEFCAWWARRLADGGGLLGEACANAGAMVGALIKEREGPQTAAEKLEAALAATRARVEATKRAAVANLTVKLTPQVLEKQARRLFAQVDEDSSGRLDVDEVQILATKLGLDMSPEEAFQAMEAMDGDSSGEVDFSEFFAWFSKTVMDVQDAKNAVDTFSPSPIRGIDESTEAPADTGAVVAPESEGTHTGRLQFRAADENLLTSLEASRWTDGLHTWRGMMSDPHQTTEQWDN